jgi:hypothetical protein
MSNAIPDGAVDAQVFVAQALHVHAQAIGFAYQLFVGLCCHGLLSTGLLDKFCIGHSGHNGVRPPPLKQPT